MDYKAITSADTKVLKSLSKRPMRGKTLIWRELLTMWKIAMLPIQGVGHAACITTKPSLHAFVTPTLAENARVGHPSQT